MRGKRKMDDFNFREVLVFGSIGLLLGIVGEIIQDSTLKIMGIMILAIIFVGNSKTLIRRVEKLERRK